MFSIAGRLKKYTSECESAGRACCQGGAEWIANGDARMAEFDNIQKIAPFLDKHLLLNLLEHVQSQNVSVRQLCSHSAGHGVVSGQAERSSGVGMQGRCGLHDAWDKFSKTAAFHQDCAGHHANIAISWCYLGGPTFVETRDGFCITRQIHLPAIVLYRVAGCMQCHTRFPR